MTKPKERPPSQKLFDENGVLVEEAQEEKQREVCLKFSEDLLISTRKKLFVSKLSLQEFLGFLMFKLSLDDVKMLQLLAESSEFSKRDVTKSRKQKNSSKITSDDLYDFFEEVDKKNL